MTEQNVATRERSKTNFVAWCLLVLAGMTTGACQTLSVQRSSAVETREALTSVAGGLAGRPLSEEESRRLETQIRTDPGAREAVRKIAASMSEAPKAKYCPVGGEHYAPNVEVCPVHKVRLLMLDN